MDRRSLLKALGAAGAVGVATRLVGCGSLESPVTSTLKEGTRRVLVYDLVMEGWSTLGSGYLGDNGILRATMIRDFQDVTLNYVQDSHGHKFDLTQADFAKILLGEQVNVLTTYRLEHRHEVRIKQTRRVPNSQPIEVEIDETGRPVGARWV
jgi:hypothetical protein